jgi:hypothetical protein
MTYSHRDLDLSGHIARAVSGRSARSDAAGRQMLHIWLDLNAHMRADRIERGHSYRVVGFPS